jgi:CBS domain-containing protein
MERKVVKDLMLSLEEYAVVPEDATLQEAIEALDEAQRKVPPGRQPHRAVLVVDKRGKVVGKVGHLAFLKALEPKYMFLGNVEALSRAGLSEEFIQSMMENLRFWKRSLDETCSAARRLKVKDIMHPAEHSIDENGTLAEALHKFIVWQTLSLLVTRRGEVVGILRLSDLFDEMARYIRGLKS